MRETPTLSTDVDGSSDTQKNIQILLVRLVGLVRLVRLVKLTPGISQDPPRILRIP